jgi:tRNA (mo5U34)-methyltransferase
LQISDDLTGKTVLDVGAWDGFFTFELERRGAKVTAVDESRIVIQAGYWAKGASMNGQAVFGGSAAQRSSSNRIGPHL